MSSGKTGAKATAAFASWNGRISPVFDVAGHVHLVEASGGTVLVESDHGLPAPAELRVARLSELGVGELICGAISRSLHMALQASGIRVTPFVAGEISQVVQAWLSGGLKAGSFAMPGCGRPRRRRLRQRQDRPDIPASFLRGQEPSRRSPGRRRGQDKLCGSVCVCPNCSGRVALASGWPCHARFCPFCGARMLSDGGNN